MMQQRPVFIKIDEYKEALGLIDDIKGKLADANSLVGKIAELRAKEDAELEHWKAQLDEIDRKVDFVDKTLFEQQH